jgi:hypothetical protein
VVGVRASIGRWGSVSPIPWGNVYFTPDDRLYPGLVSVVIKLDSPEHVAVVCNRNGIHAEALRFLQHLINANGPVQEAIFGVDMKVNKW